jgi:hypothetical protein
MTRSEGGRRRRRMEALDVVGENKERDCRNASQASATMERVSQVGGSRNGKFGPQLGHKPTTTGFGYPRRQFHPSCCYYIHSYTNSFLTVLLFSYSLLLLTPQSTSPPNLRLNTCLPHHFIFRITPSPSHYAPLPRSFSCRGPLIYSIYILYISSSTMIAPLVF